MVVTLISGNCVNSKWEAFGLNKNTIETCECGFKCKVRVSLEVNGHQPYTYVLTVKEYKNLLKKQSKE